jgi:GTPase SAR1 family protein
MSGNMDGRREFRNTRRDDIRALAISPDGNILAAATFDGIELYEWKSGRRQRGLAPGVPFHSVAFDQSGRYLAGGASGELRVWDLYGGVRGRELRVSAHAGVRITTLATGVSQGSALLLTAGDDGTAIIWEMATLRELNRMPSFRGVVSGAVLQRDASRAIIGTSTSGSNLFLMSINGDREAIARAPGGVSCLTSNPQNSLLAVGTRSGNIELLTPDLSSLSLTLEGHTGEVASLHFTLDGGFLVSRADDRTIKVWEVATGELLASINDRKQPDGGSRQKICLNAVDGRAVINEDDKLVTFDLETQAMSGAIRDSVYYVTKRVALVGDSGVGKTSLGWRMIHGEFQPQESTHGQKFWIVESLSKKMRGEPLREVVLWDFAGQPEYRLVHSLFLDDIDCALILFDSASREDPLHGVRYWLKQLISSTYTSPSIALVGSRSDRGVPAVAQSDLTAFCADQGIELGYISVSAKTGEGVPELLNLIERGLAAAPSSVTVTSKAFHTIKSIVISLKADPTRQRSLFSVPDLASEISARSGREFDIRSITTAVQALRNHGYVELLENSAGILFVLLEPDFLIRLASSIVIEARRNPRGLGALDEHELLSGSQTFPELTAASSSESHILLDGAVQLFLRHNICFRETIGSQTFLVYPSLISQAKPIVGEAPVVDDVTYFVTGSTETVFAALVVLLGYTNTFYRTSQWRDHAEYEIWRRAEDANIQSPEVCGFRQVAVGEDAVELVLYYGVDTHESVKMLFQGLFENFLRRRDLEVRRFPTAACSECGYRQERTTIVRRIRQGKNFVICEECGERVALADAMTLVPLPEHAQQKVDAENLIVRQRSAYEALLVRIKALVRDRDLNRPTCFFSYAWGDEDTTKRVRLLASDLADAGINVLLDIWDNASIGSSISRFVTSAASADFIAVIGTPLYKQKYSNRISESGSVVAAEADLIESRLLGTEDEKNTILPVLLAGKPEQVFPPLVVKRVYADFRPSRPYFVQLIDLILTLYKISFRDSVVQNIREIVSEHPE